MKNVTNKTLEFVQMLIEKITRNAFKIGLRLFLNRQAEIIELQIEMLNKSDKSLKS
jgi:hypothetical protein